MPQPGLNGRCGYQPRGRGLGGSSAINAMVYIRGCAWDYDNWAELGANGWSYREVLPWFKRAECNTRGADDYHGGDGPLHVTDQHWPHPASRLFVEAASQLQLPVTPDFNLPSNEGFGLFQVTQHKGERWSAARAYVDPQVAAGRLNVMTDTLVERVEVVDGRATCVSVVRGGRRETVRARGAVVLAGGAFGTPQLLQLSGIGPAAHLADFGIPVLLDRPAVGADLQDHIDYVAGYEVPGTIFMGPQPRALLRTAVSLLRWFASRTGPLTTPYAEGCGFAKSTPDAPAPDLQFHFVPGLLEDHGRAKVKANGFSCHVCVLRPESRGTVRLASPDPAAAPLIDPQFLSDDRDTQTLLRGVKLMRRILEAPALAAYGGKERHTAGIDDDERLIEIIRNRADTVYHPVGTARMGSDPDAVVDPRLKLRGVDGLYVADASVMPRLVSGNTNAPTIMIGERCAAFVAEDLG